MGASPWNDASKTKLLLAIIHLSAPKLPNWDQVATLMGEGFTAESTRQHFQKMRKECDTKFRKVDGDTPRSSPSKGTPRKPKAKANGENGTPSKGNGLKRKASDDDEDRGDDAPDVKKRGVKKEEEAEPVASDFPFEFN